MKCAINIVETDFVEYLAERRNEPTDAVLAGYLRLREQCWGFQGKRFRRTSSAIQTIYHLFRNPRTEQDVLNAYRELADLHLLIYLAGSFPKPFSDRLRDAAKMLAERQFSQFFLFGRRYVTSQLCGRSAVDTLLDAANGPPVIVDYGCGPAHLALMLCRKNPSAKAYLVDIDTTAFEFAVFRFRKYGCPFETIHITGDNLYPDLPCHNICIANEVMEHVFDPLRVYRNIHSAMDTGGLLFGNFANHEPNMLHVSPDLSTLRESLGLQYENIAAKVYKKIR